MKTAIARMKPLLRWFILGAVVFFLVQVLKTHWQGVTAIRITAAGWATLAIALGVTLLAHICAGWVWAGMLQRDFQQPVQTATLIPAYLQTNIAKYLPGNIWHYYGRVTAATQAGATLETAAVSVALEPLLMAASALLVGLLSGQAIATRYGAGTWGVFGGGLVITLLVIHPKFLNPVMQRLAQTKLAKARAQADTPAPPLHPSRLQHYPAIALLGNLLFLILRGIGFLFAFQAILAVDWAQVPILLSGFSVAWLLGLIVPGAPGGLGIFEATAIALLGHLYPAAALLAVVACYRLVSVGAEALGAGLSWVEQRLLLGNLTRSRRE